MMKRILRDIIRIIVIIITALLLFEGVRLLMLVHSVGGYKKYWVERAKEPAPAGGLLYVALGDSAAQGLGASRPEKGYVGLIAHSLEQTSGRPVHVLNLSVSGAKVQDVIDDQLPKLQRLNVAADAVVTIEIGANDMSSWDEAAFKIAMQKLMAELPSQTVISDMPYFGGGRKRNLEQHVLVANQIIEQLATNYGLRVAPLHEVTKTKDSILTMAADLLHPSDRGYRNWYEAFRRVLNP